MYRKLRLRFGGGGFVVSASLWLLIVGALPGLLKKKPTQFHFHLCFRVSETLQWLLELFPEHLGGLPGLSVLERGYHLPTRMPAGFISNCGRCQVQQEGHRVESSSCWEWDSWERVSGKATRTWLLKDEWEMLEGGKHSKCKGRGV